MQPAPSTARLAAGALAVVTSAALGSAVATSAPASATTQQVQAYAPADTATIHPGDRHRRL